jgi:hypothetical protein
LEFSGPARPGPFSALFATTKETYYDELREQEAYMQQTMTQQFHADFRSEFFLDS